MAMMVNGELIRDDQFNRAFLQVSGGRSPQLVQQQSVSEFRNVVQRAEEFVVRSILLRQLAEREGLTVSARETEEARRTVWGSAANERCGVGVSSDLSLSLLVRKAEQHVTRHLQRPSRREVEALYHANRPAFSLPERWLVSHIVRFAEDGAERLSAMDVLAAAARDLKRGKAFAVVADRYSDCRGNGGSLGWIQRGSMVAEFEMNVFGLKRRTVSDVFSTPFGLHIAIVLDYKPAGLQPLDEIRLELAHRIFEDRKRTHVDRVVSELFARADVEIVTEAQYDVRAG